MGLFDSAAGGVKLKRTRHVLRPRKIFDCRFGELIPAFHRFVMPGDVWKITTNMFIRFLPMLSPSLTRCFARIRYFFVPLRLLDENTELIITGSKNGKLYKDTLPTYNGVFDRVDSSHQKKVEKYSFYDYFTMPVGDYSLIAGDKSIPAEYWPRAYLRAWFDYYRDENFDDFDDFDDFANSVFASNQLGVAGGLLNVRLHKDYFTSSLPWQMKGVTPTFSINPIADFTGAVYAASAHGSNPGNVQIDYTDRMLMASNEAYNGRLVQALNKVQISGGDFNIADLRLMYAQSRIFERLARCGSRFTEYLRSNFGIAPADDTLQRAQFLGGQTQPIVMTEVVQTAGDGLHPVGTLRGHAISNDVGSIQPFVAKEFGVILGLFDIMPEITYTQGIDRELCFRSRFDFPNPSFQHLSEQEVRNGELFISPDDGKNDATFGFQPMYNELRSYRSCAVGDMRDTLSYWNQAVHFGTRPNLNKDFLDAGNYRQNFNQPFAVSGDDARPVIVDFGTICDTYRLLDKFGNPGGSDHL